MRHFCAVIAICAAAFLGAGFAQDIPTDTSTALASEWSTPASTPHCLAALEIYAAYSLAGVPVSPPQASDATLNELLSVFTRNDLARLTDLHKQMIRCLSNDTSAKGCLSVSSDRVPNTY